MTHSTGLFFDLDGTLTDPKPGITACIQFALQELAHPVPSQDELEWCIGPPLLENFRVLVGPEDAQAAVDLYRERFSEVGLFENAVYPGVASMLAEARGRGASLFVASSKPRVFVTRILEHFSLAEYFTGVFGSELDGTRTDKAELLAFALRESGASADRSTMIGDRSHDAIGALHNRMDFVGALYGYGSQHELRAAGALRWVERPGELVAALFGGDPER